MVGVPGPTGLQTEIRIPPDTVVPSNAVNKIVVHNDPSIDRAKAWPWQYLEQFVQSLGPEDVVLLGSPGPKIGGVLDLRGLTTLSQAAAIIARARCYVGIDSGLMWIAGSLGVPTVGLYGTSYIAAYDAIQPRNPNALYLQAEGPLDALAPANVSAAMRHVVARSLKVVR